MPQVFPLLSVRAICVDRQRGDRFPTCRTYIDLRDLVPDLRRSIKSPRNDCEKLRYICDAHRARLRADRQLRVPICDSDTANPYCRTGPPCYRNPACERAMVSSLIGRRDVFTERWQCAIANLLAHVTASFVVIDFKRDRSICTCSHRLDAADMFLDLTKYRRFDRERVRGYPTDLRAGGYAISERSIRPCTSCRLRHVLVDVR
jgi:hypothetical protein